MLIGLSTIDSIPMLRYLLRYDALPHTLNCLAYSLSNISVHFIMYSRMSCYSSPRCNYLFIPPSPVADLFLSSHLLARHIPQIPGLPVTIAITTVDVTHPRPPYIHHCACTLYDPRFVHPTYLRVRSKHFVEWAVSYVCRTLGCRSTRL